MADRTSADLFGYMFRMLAKSPSDEHKEMARGLWQMMRRFDFSPYQMCCNDSLIALGIAKRVSDPDRPDDSYVEYDE